MNVDLKQTYAPALLDERGQRVVEELRADVEGMIEGSGLAIHPYFSNLTAPQINQWILGELHVSPVFTQVFTRAHAAIDNVNVAAYLAPVITGERGRKIQDGVAVAAHANLLHGLALETGAITREQKTFTPPQPAVTYVEAMEGALGHNLMHALGFLGGGSEMLITSEYMAVKDVFDRLGIQTKFLDANISEDEVHGDLVLKVAAMLNELDPETHRTEDFLAGARAGIDARVQFYDRMQALKV